MSPVPGEQPPVLSMQQDNYLERNPEASGDHCSSGAYYNGLQPPRGSSSYDTWILNYGNMHI